MMIAYRARINGVEPYRIQSREGLCRLLQEQNVCEIYTCLVEDSVCFRRVVKLRGSVRSSIVV